MSDAIALIRPPASDVAPGYRRSLAERAHFAVDDFGDDVLGIAPVEGPGRVADHFALSKICDATSDLSSPELWQPLRDRPPKLRDDVDGPRYRDQLIEKGTQLREQNPGIASELVSFSLAAMGAAQAGDLTDLFRANLPALFEQFPFASFWYVGISDVLLARLAFSRTQLTLQLTPDMPVGPDMERLKAMSKLGLTEGVNVGALVSLPMVLLSPAALGFVVPVLPHAFVFCFATAVDLRRPYPTSLASVYRPAVLDDPASIDRSALIDALDERDGPELLVWWVNCLNRLYSHIADPTRFTDAGGYHDASAHTAWMVTLERLLADCLSLLAEPQAADLHRVQIAFDLLDKAEGLLGYGRNRTGKGFEALLRRSTSVRRLGEAFGSLPDRLSERLSDETRRLFDGLYSEVLVNALDYRRGRSSVRVATKQADDLQALDEDTYVSRLCRAVRNSSHGILDTLRSHDDRFLLATNTGGIPAELSALAPLIAVGLVADAESLIDGTWREKLTQQGR